MSLLEVKNLKVAVNKERRLIPVIHGVSLSIEPGQTLGIVGESGCGKSLASLAIMGLLAGSQVRVTGGQILFEGKDLLHESPSKRRALMGSRMAMIFQEPMTSLNSVYRIGDHIIETIRQHQNLNRHQAESRAVELLEQVRIPIRRASSLSIPINCPAACANA